jgi:hypothetical protein
MPEKYDEDARWGSGYESKEWSEAIAHMADLIKNQSDEDIMEHVIKVSKEREHFCTGCLKVHPGIDCECTEKLNIEDVPERDSMDEVLDLFEPKPIGEENET